MSECANITVTEKTDGAKNERISNTLVVDSTFQAAAVLIHYTSESTLPELLANYGYRTTGR